MLVHKWAALMPRTCSSEQRPLLKDTGCWKEKAGEIGHVKVCFGAVASSHRDKTRAQMHMQGREEVPAKTHLGISWLDLGDGVGCTQHSAGSTLIKLHHLYHAADLQVVAAAVERQALANKSNLPLGTAPCSPPANLSSCPCHACDR